MPYVPISSPRTLAENEVEMLEIICVGVLQLKDDEQIVITKQPLGTRRPCKVILQQKGISISKQSWKWPPK